MAKSLLMHVNTTCLRARLNEGAVRNCHLRFNIIFLGVFYMSIRSLIPSLWAENTSKDPFQNLQSEVDRVFRQFRDFGPLAYTESNNGGELGKLIPKINVAESEKQYEVEVELPGVSQENVEVTVLNQSLIIEGHRKSESTKEEKDYRVVERSEGSFKRVIPLGFDVADEDVDAKFKDGVLAIKVNKPAELAQKAKKIKIEKVETA